MTMGPKCMNYLLPCHKKTSKPIIKIIITEIKLTQGQHEPHVVAFYYRPYRLIKEC